MDETPAVPVCVHQQPVTVSEVNVLALFSSDVIGEVQPGGRSRDMRRAVHIGSGLSDIEATSWVRLEALRFGNPTQIQGLATKRFNAQLGEIFQKALAHHPENELVNEFSFLSVAGSGKKGRDIKPRKLYRAVLLNTNDIDLLRASGAQEVEFPAGPSLKVPGFRLKLGTFANKKKLIETLRVDIRFAPQLMTGVNVIDSLVCLHYLRRRIVKSLIKRRLSSSILTNGTYLLDSLQYLDGSKLPIIVKFRGGEEVEAIISGETEFEISLAKPDDISSLRGESEGVTETVRETLPPADLCEVAGLDAIKHEIEEMVLHPLTHADTYAAHGVQAPRGLLLHGVPGTGKSLMCREITRRIQAVRLERGLSPVVTVAIRPGPRVIDQLNEALGMVEGQADGALLLVLDEVDAICPDRGAMETTEADRKAVAAFLAVLDGAEQNPAQIFVLATTNRVDSVDKALRRHGRIDQQIELGPPTENDRLSILQFYTRKSFEGLVPKEIECCLREIANRAHGFVGADLERVIKKAQTEVVRRVIKGDSEATMGESELLRSFQGTTPSGMIDDIIACPNVQWEDIGGYEVVKQSLRECVEWPERYKSLFMKFGIRAPAGVLLYGPPGCCKTMMAKAVATQCGRNFLNVKGPELFSMWVGESEAGVRRLFLKARQNAPSVVFIDEIESMGTTRDGGGANSVESRVLTQLLTEMDGIQKHADVFVMGATNRPDLLDAALIRPGRLDRLVLVDLPDGMARHQIFNIHLGDHKIDTKVRQRLVDKSEGLSGAEIGAVVKEVQMSEIGRRIRDNDTAREDFEMDWGELEKAVERTKPRTSETQVSFYREFAASKSNF